MNKTSMRQKSTSERVSERGTKLPANERRGEKEREREREIPLLEVEELLLYLFIFTQSQNVSK